MKHAVCLLAALMLLHSGEVLGAGEAATSAEPKEKKSTASRRDVKAGLRQRVTVDFMDADLDWVLHTLFVLSGMNIISDPEDMDRAGPVTIHAEDIAIQELLEAICKQSNLKWRVGENAVHIHMPQEERERVEKEIMARKKLEQQKWSASKLRVTLPEGTEIQAEGALLQRQPTLLAEILDRALDPARDGLVAYPMKEKDPLLDKVMAALEAVTPKVQAIYRQDIGFLVVRAEQPKELRRATALLRALGLRRGPLPSRMAQSSGE